MKLYLGLLDAMCIEPDGTAHKGHYIGHGKYSWRTSEMDWQEILDFVLENGLRKSECDDEMLMYVGLSGLAWKKESI